MNKGTTTREVKRRAPFARLMEAAGMDPARLAADSKVSIATVYRARGGTVPGILHLEALAAALRVTPDACREAIEASGRRVARAS